MLTTMTDLQDVMVVNYLSPFVFTRTLLPLLEQTAKEPGADVRIVNVSVFLDHETLYVIGGLDCGVRWPLVLL